MPTLASTISAIISLVVSLSIPLSILMSRYAIKKKRQSTLRHLRQTLRVSTNRDATLIPDFEYALQKYDLDAPVPGLRSKAEIAYYLGTMLIFSAISWAGMTLLLEHGALKDPEGERLLLIGLQSAISPASSRVDFGVYEKSTVAVIAFSFLGAYIWSVQYLIRRISSYDLTPTSFLRASMQVIFACVLSVVLRHTLPAPVTDFASGGGLLLTAFMIGFFPNSGFDYLSRKLPNLRIKRTDEDVPASLRVLPVDMIDGIDSQVGFRLAEREIVDVQNLAAENPILLCAETPYTLLAVMDWISQAQLILEVGPKSYRRLRDLGVRSIFSLEKAAADPELEAFMIGVLYEDVPSRPKDLSHRIEVMKANLHVQRMYSIWEIVSECYRVRSVQRPEEAHVVPFEKPLGA